MINQNKVIEDIKKSLRTHEGESAEAWFQQGYVDELKFSEPNIILGLGETAIGLCEYWHPQDHELVHAGILIYKGYADFELLAFVDSADTLTQLIVGGPEKS